MNNQPAVFLDYESLQPDDLDNSQLFSVLPDLQIYSFTPPEQVIERIADAEIVICNKVVLGRDELRSAPHLKCICVSATGTNNIDLEAATELGIDVCNVRNYGTQSVVEHVLLLMLSLVRRFPDYQQSVDNGEWQKSDQFCLMHHSVGELAGKTLGIIGYGTLGKAVAAMAKCLGMQVLIANRAGKVEIAEGRVALADLFAQSDVISLHCLLSDDTENLIDQAVFEQMKPSAFLINVARGGIVHEADLLYALKTNQIAGAALDVLSTEPPDQDSVLMQQSLPNLIITPHMAWISQTARQNLLNQLVEIIKSYQLGKPIQVVN